MNLGDRLTTCKPKGLSTLTQVIGEMVPEVQRQRRCGEDGRLSSILERFGDVIRSDGGFAGEIRDGSTDA
jgi:hypothetical protein